jgi:hypothetical protein
MQQSPHRSTTSTPSHALHLDAASLREMGLAFVLAYSAAYLFSLI